MAAAHDADGQVEFQSGQQNNAKTLGSTGTGPISHHYQETSSFISLQQQQDWFSVEPQRSLAGAVLVELATHLLRFFFFT